jgi:hypothetical protein
MAPATDKGNYTDRVKFRSPIALEMNEDGQKMENMMNNRPFIRQMTMLSR